MNVSLVACLARPARCAGSRGAFLPARSVTRLQRSRPLLNASPLVWALGGTRNFSWNPFGSVWKTQVPTASPASEILTPSPPRISEENVTATAQAASQPVGDSASALPDVSSVVDAGASETLLDSISDAAETMATQSVLTSSADIQALGWAPWLLDFVQISTGLPWWGSVILATAGIRLVLVPLIIKSVRTQAKMAPLQPKLTEIRDRGNKAKAEGDRFAASQAYQENMMLLKKHNISMFGSAFAPLAQAFVQIGFFIGLRRMCVLPVEQLKEGGIWWFTDLTVADPFYILPLINLACINLQLLVSRHDMLAVGTPNTPHIHNAFRAFTAVSVPFLAILPAGLNIHLIASIVFISAQTLLLRVPAIRKALSIPPLPTTAKLKPATMKETLMSIKNWYRRQVEDAQRKEAERQRKIRIAQSQRRR